MPAIKKVAYTEMFSKLNLISQVAGETNDCSVKAVALVCGIDYKVAKQLLAGQGRKERNGAYVYQIINAVKAAGGHRVEGVNLQNIIAAYPAPHRDVLKGITTHHPRRFNKHWPKGAYLLFMKRHVAACVDGVVHDWTVNKAKRITAIYKVS